MFIRFDPDFCKWVNRDGFPWEWTLKEGAPDHIKEDFERFITWQKERRKPKKNKYGTYDVV